MAFGVNALFIKVLRASFADHYYLLSLFPDELSMDKRDRNAFLPGRKAFCIVCK